MNCPTCGNGWVSNERPGRDCYRCEHEQREQLRARSYFRPGMSEETRAAIARELAGFNKRVSGFNGKMTRASLKAATALSSKAARAYFADPDCKARFRIVAGQERTNDALAQLGALGVSDIEIMPEDYTPTRCEPKHWADNWLLPTIDATDLVTLDCAAD